MHKIEMSQLGLALLVPPLNDLSCCHGIGEGMVGNEIVKLLALLGLDLIHEFTDFILKALEIGIILLLSHGVPPVGGIRAHRLTNGDVVFNLEDSEGWIILGIRLLLAWVDGVTLHARHVVHALMERSMQNATTRSELSLTLPIVGANLEDQHRLRQRTN